MIKKTNLKFGKEELDIGNSQLDFLPINERNHLILSLLKAFLKDTLESVPFYFELYRKELKTTDPVMFVNNNVKSLQDMILLPLLDPHTLRSLDSGLDLLPENYKNAVVEGRVVESDPLKRVFFSSGSTGKPKIIYYTENDWEMSSLLFGRTVHDIDVENRNKIYCTFNPGHIGGAYYENAAKYVESIFVPKHFTKNNPKEVLSDMMASPQGPFNMLQIPPRPHLATKVSKGVTLYDLIKAEGSMNINYLGENIRVVISNGGPLSSFDDTVDLINIMHRKNNIAGVDFRTRFVDQGGSAETLYNFSSCKNYEDGKDIRKIHTLHLMQGMNYIEVINPKNGQHAIHGETGLLVVTSMKKGTRFIRYMIGDSVQYIDPIIEPCKCGKTTARIFNIHRDFEKKRLESGCAGGSL